MGLPSISALRTSRSAGERDVSSVVVDAVGRAPSRRFTWIASAATASRRGGCRCWSAPARDRLKGVDEHLAA